MTKSKNSTKTKKQKKIILWGIVIFIITLIGARIYLPFWLKDYVNNVLNNIKDYKGSVENIEVHLYRGAYTIHQLKILKEEGGIPVPFFEAEFMDISVQWEALLHGRIVSNIDFTKPVVNFAVGTAGNVQTGEEVDWTQPLKHLSPFDINLLTLNNGKVTFKNFSSSPKVDIYITNVQAEIRNLRNVEDKGNPLPSPIVASGDSIGNGKFSLEGKLNILKPTPDMDLNIKLENAHLPAINKFSEAYALIDFTKGDLSVYSEIVVKDNKLSGYVKPIAQNVSVIDLKKVDNPVKLAWESVVSVFIEIFKNQPKDQLATKVPLEGDLDNVKTNMWVTIAGIFKNAFIKAFTSTTDNDINFNNTK